MVEGTDSRVPSNGDQHESVVPAQAVSARPDRRARSARRRRRSAILGGGALVAVSPVAVGAGVFVPGFVALGLGVLLLLLPPRAARIDHGRRSPLRVVGAPLSAGGRVILTSVRATGASAAVAFAAVARFATGSGRDGAARVAGVGARVATAAASGTWSAAWLASRGLLAATRGVALAVRSASSALWARSRPLLDRAWAAGVAGSVRGGHEFDALARTASERLSTAVDTKQAFDRLASRPPRNPPRRVRGPREPIPRAPRSRHHRRPRGHR